MTAARADLADLPYWPRGLSLAQAAAYVGVSENTFLEEVDDGLWPGPEERGRRRIWDRVDIDTFWDRRKQGKVVPISTAERALRWGAKSG